MTPTSSPPGAALAPTNETLNDPGRANQHVFRVLLDGLAHPGSLRSLIVHPSIAGEPRLARPYVASILVTMLDHEVSLHIGPAVDAEALREIVVRRTGVAISDAGNADVVVAIDPDDRLPESLKRGSLEFPDDSATLIVSVPSLTDVGGDPLDLTLQGPGIDGSCMLRVPGLSPGLVESRNRAVAGYPTGIDLVLVDAAGSVACIPRTTTITIAQEGSR